MVTRKRLLIEPSQLLTQGRKKVHFPLTFQLSFSCQGLETKNYKSLAVLLKPSKLQSFDCMNGYDKFFVLNHRHLKV